MGAGVLLLASCSRFVAILKSGRSLLNGGEGVACRSEISKDMFNPNPNGQRKADQQEIEGNLEYSQIGRVENAEHIEVDGQRQKYMQKYCGDKDHHGLTFYAAC